MNIEIWSDVVCPWCYVGKRNFETALEEFEHRDDVTVTFRSFELDPTAPVEREGPYATHLARKYGMSENEARSMIGSMTKTGARAGVVLDFEKARPGNTFDAHRLLHLAAEKGVQGELKERLLRATFSEGEPVGDRAALVRRAEEVGIAAGEAAEALDGGAYAAEVRADEELALELGISAVPFFVIDRKFGIPGAQAPDVILAALRRAWEKGGGPPGTPDGPPDSGSCSSDDCSITS
jgi:predicted DsbA family dithiol-disulfide isomerase